MAGKSSNRSRQSVRDMVLSMLAVGGVVAVAYVFVPHSEGDGVHAVPYSVEAASARRAAPYPLLSPEGLPAKWRATSVQYTDERQTGSDGHNIWHLGFVTPSGQYAAVEQSDAPRDELLGRMVAGGAADGSAAVAGRTWDRVQGGKARALAVQSGTATTLVTGTASYEELVELAQALK
ncbi:DUF4245 domain-containing protein [Kitasatospora sp. NPDC057223]|uniref:DUF4245 domain-containing protein n=1 Tax=Kitasatospora sp. NPDC057223 TaxID=3346055 RepID=UPI0036312548